MEVYLSLSRVSWGIGFDSHYLIPHPGPLSSPILSHPASPALAPPGGLPGRAFRSRPGLTQLGSPRCQSLPGPPSRPWVFLCCPRLCLCPHVSVKTPVGSVSPFPFWILNKYLKLRQWNDGSVAVYTSLKSPGKVCGRAGGSGGGPRGASCFCCCPHCRGGRVRAMAPSQEGWR